MSINELSEWENSWVVLAYKERYVNAVQPKGFA